MTENQQVAIQVPPPAGFGLLADLAGRTVSEGYQAYRTGEADHAAKANQARLAFERASQSADERLLAGSPIMTHATRITPALESLASTGVSLAQLARANASDVPAALDDMELELHAIIAHATDVLEGETDADSTFVKQRVASIEEAHKFLTAQSASAMNKQSRRVGEFMGHLRAAELLSGAATEIQALMQALTPARQ